MAFASKILEKWVSQQVDTLQPRSDRYGFETNIYGIPAKDHPFKIHMVSSSAPVLSFAKTIIPQDEINNFTINLALSKGVIYDLSLFERDIRKPLYVSKRNDGRFLAIRGAGKTKEFITEEKLSLMEIPVTINGKSMVDVLPGVNYGPEISLSIKTNAGFDFNYDGSGCLFLEVVLRDQFAGNPNNSRFISSASIMTAPQIKAKYPGAIVSNTGVILSDLQSRRTRFIVIYSAVNSSYICLNSADSLLWKTLVYPDSFSEEFARALELQRNQGTFFFIYEPHPYERVLKNDLFLRIR